jgi:riboflavin synthase
MFTGIVETTGQILRAEELGFGRRLLIEAPALGLDEVKIGDSIAVNGTCLTVTGKGASSFSVDVIAETLARTAGLDARHTVNLEKSMRFGDRVDGHLVSGHIDGTGAVAALERHAESWLLIVEAPTELARFFAYKGSIAVNGVSLTIARVEDAPTVCRVWIALIPHTMEVTTLKHLVPGDRVNLEVDMIARYVERMLSARGV